ncbi:glutamate 5-kinase [uncultured Sphingomonas sp.]|uniref:glutamate 5-kinase n=1 Tax=uncultured Sphingomonas sp. TaxID=158754 RepID=UPI0035CBBD12
MADDEPTFPALLADASRITLKIGSSLLIGPDGSGLSTEWLADLAADIAGLRRAGKQVVVVSSGAVALGRDRLGTRRSPRLELKQAAAAIGQPLLMRAWGQALGEHGIGCAQLLLTLDDTERRRRWLNARATTEALLAHGLVPIVNENDSVATDELRYGDNDRLSARAAQLVRSDLLILLSDVDGLHTADPARDPAARHVPVVAEITPAILALAGDASVAGPGTGGMRTKLAAAGIAGAFGCSTVIASGHAPHPIAALSEGARCTIFPARVSPASAYKQWIAASLDPAGSVAVDAGAARALAGGASLLPAGVRSVTGAFGRGACLRVLGPDGAEIARGLSAYDAAEARAIAGAGSARIPALLGYVGPDELIHRGDLVLR